MEREKGALLFRLGGNGSILPLRTIINNISDFKMKIEIDFDNKKIRIEETIQLGKFIDQLKALFPDNEWKKFGIEPQRVIEWRSPIVVQPFRQPYWWQNQPTMKYEHKEHDFDHIRGTYCLKVE